MRYAILFLTALLWAQLGGEAAGLSQISVRKVYGAEVYTVSDKNADDQYVVDAINETRVYFPGTDSLKIPRVVIDSIHARSATNFVTVVPGDTLQISHGIIEGLRLDTLRADRGSLASPVQDTLIVADLNIHFTSGESWTTRLSGIGKVAADSITTDSLTTGGPVTFHSGATSTTFTSAVTSNFTGGLQVGGSDLVANDSNNRVLTATGSGTANGEANLTFDGATLSIEGGAAEGWDSDRTAVQIGGAAALWSTTTEAAGNSFMMSHGTYFDGSFWRYQIANEEATVFYMQDGVFYWLTGNSTSHAADATFSPSTSMSIDASGNVNIPGLTASSDVQTDGSKNLISTSDSTRKVSDGFLADGTYQKLLELRPRYFRWKSDIEKGITDAVQLGFYAQEVYPLLPEAAPRFITIDTTYTIDGPDTIMATVADTAWGFNSSALTAALVKSLQESHVLFNTELGERDSVIAILEARIDSLAALP